ncbi:hypothetical protein K8R30_01165 [archaeon]|nr:hypothetical protein [archaeon]
MKDYSDIPKSVEYQSGRTQETPKTGGLFKCVLALGAIISVATALDYFIEGPTRTKQNLFYAGATLDRPDKILMFKENQDDLNSCFSIEGNPKGLTKGRKYNIKYEGQYVLPNKLKDISPSN